MCCFMKTFGKCVLSTLLQFTQLYLAIDSGMFLYEQPSRINSCICHFDRALNDIRITSIHMCESVVVVS